MPVTPTEILPGLVSGQLRGMRGDGAIKDRIDRVLREGMVETDVLRRRAAGTEMAAMATEGHEIVGNAITGATRLHSNLINLDFKAGFFLGAFALVVNTIGKAISMIPRLSGAEGVAKTIVDHVEAPFDIIKKTTWNGKIFHQKDSSRFGEFKPFAEAVGEKAPVLGSAAKFTSDMLSPAAKVAAKTAQNVADAASGPVAAVVEKTRLGTLMKRIHTSMAGRNARSAQRSFEKFEASIPSFPPGTRDSFIKLGNAVNGAKVEKGIFQGAKKLAEAFKNSEDTIGLLEQRAQAAFNNVAPLRNAGGLLEKASLAAHHHQLSQQAPSWFKFWVDKSKYQDFHKAEAARILERAQKSIDGVDLNIVHRSMRSSFEAIRTAKVSDLGSLAGHTERAYKVIDRLGGLAETSKNIPPGAETFLGKVTNTLDHLKQGKLWKKNPVKDSVKNIPNDLAHAPIYSTIISGSMIAVSGLEAAYHANDFWKNVGVLKHMKADEAGKKSDQLSTIGTLVGSREGRHLLGLAAIKLASDAVNMGYNILDMRNSKSGGWKTMATFMATQAVSSGAEYVVGQSMLPAYGTFRKAFHSGHVTVEDYATVISAFNARYGKLNDDYKQLKKDYRQNHPLVLAVAAQLMEKKTTPPAIHAMQASGELENIGNTIIADLKKAKEAKAHPPVAPEQPQVSYVDNLKTSQDKSHRIAVGDVTEKLIKKDVHAQAISPGVV